MRYVYNISMKEIKNNDSKNKKGDGKMKKLVKYVYEASGNVHLSSLKKAIAFIEKVYKDQYSKIEKSTFKWIFINESDGKGTEVAYILKDILY